MAQTLSLGKLCFCNFNLFTKCGMWQSQNQHGYPVPYPVIMWMYPPQCMPNPPLLPLTAHSPSLESPPQNERNERPVKSEERHSNEQNVRVFHSPNPEVASYEVSAGDAEASGNQDRKMRRQKSGRNIFSNIFRSFLRYMGSQSFRLAELPRIKQRYNLNIKEKDLKKKLKSLTQNMKSYVKKKEMQEFFEQKDDPDADFYFFLRVAIRYYVKCKHHLEIFDSKKIQKDFRRVHLRQRRKLLYILTQKSESCD